MGRIQGVAFNLEGTLVDVEPAHHGGWIAAAEEIGVNFDGPFDAIQRCPHFSGGPDKDIVHEIYSLRPGSPMPSAGQLGAFIERKWYHYDRLIEKLDLSPRTGAMEVLEYLASIEFPTSIGTAAGLEPGIAIMRRSGLDKLFTLDKIVLSMDVRNLKPAPDCFIETARRMRIDPANQIVFEDSPLGVRSAVAAGSQVIAMPVYDTPIVRERLLDAGATTILKHWGEVNIGILLGLE